MVFPGGVIDRNPWRGTLDVQADGLKKTAGELQQPGRGGSGRKKGEDGPWGLLTTFQRKICTFSRGKTGRGVILTGLTSDERLSKSLCYLNLSVAIRLAMSLF